jgi:nuclear pore complex protein Nup160
MANNLLVSVHLSSLYSPAQVNTISIHTSRRNVPLPSPGSSSDPPPEHASFSSFFSSQQTGTILFRLIHNRLILELLSLTTETSPIRFVFPSEVLPNPSVFLWQSRELHILAATSIGSLYRIVLPICNAAQLWQDQMSNNWCREYHVKNIQDASAALMKVQGAHCVAIAFTNGSFLRLDTDFIGDDSSDGEISELPRRLLPD